MMKGTGTTYQQYVVEKVLSVNKVTRSNYGKYAPTPPILISQKEKKKDRWS